MLQSVPEQEWRKLHQATDQAERIRQRASLIIRGLKNVFAENDDPSVPAIRFTEAEAASPARIHTPFGVGRFDLSWTVSDALCGRLIAERQDFNALEKMEWVPALQVIVPADGSPYMGGGDDRQLIFLDRELGHHRTDSLFKLGMSILYAFAQVPKH